MQMVAFTGLIAQPEACEAFIRSQAGEGWRLVKAAYDDGAFRAGQWSALPSSACWRISTTSGTGALSIITPDTF